MKAKRAPKITVADSYPLEIGSTWCSQEIPVEHWTSARLPQPPSRSGHTTIPIFAIPLYITSCTVHLSDHLSWFYKWLLDRLCWAKFRCDHACVKGGEDKDRWSQSGGRSVCSPSSFGDHLLQDVGCVCIYWVREGRRWSSFHLLEIG